MKSEFTKADQQVLEKVLQGSFGGLSSVDPAILSCGGIYVPHQNETQRVIYRIIITSNQEMPVKVVTGVRPKNILHLLMQKEAMN
ncbi:MAG: hypothetical protein ABH859_05760 [Pseudomonadota bacterium]